MGAELYVLPLFYLINTLQFSKIYDTLIDLICAKILLILFL